MSKILNSNLLNKISVLLRSQQPKVELQDTSYETNDTVTNYQLHKILKMQ